MTSRWVRWENGAVFLILLTVTIIFRGSAIGDPNYHIDESLYLLIGDALSHGALPYVDIWDRKPLGLFLVYAAMAKLGRGVVPYQVCASIAALATALLIAQLARRRGGAVGAVLAGSLYLFGLSIFLGGGGQSPVFYNLPIVAAFSLLVKEWEDRGTAFLGRRGNTAVFLCGLAAFIKPTAIFEGAAIGLGFIYLVWKQRGSGAAAQRLLLFALIGAVPTLGGLLAYAILGHADSYWFANFVSIFRRISDAWLGFGQFWTFLLILSPLIAATLLCMSQSGYAGMPVILYAAGAWCGFAAIPNFFAHYCLPLLPPMIIAAAWGFRSARAGQVYLVAIIAFWFSIFGLPDAAERDRSARQFAALTKAVNDYRAGGCIYVFDGPVSLYRSTGACRVTPYVFPEHLNFAAERKGLPLAPRDAMTRLLEKKPAVIVVRQRPVVSSPNLITRTILRTELQAHYRLAETLPETTVEYTSNLDIWVRQTR